MILIACVDDKMGMTFNGRRQSRDRMVCEDMVTMCQGRPLYIEECSRKLFQDIQSSDIRVTDAACPALYEDGYVFAERPEVIEAGISAAPRIILYRWNRKYPADQYFPVDLKEWTLISSEEFAGKSHEKITKEVWERA